MLRPHTRLDRGAGPDNRPRLPKGEHMTAKERYDAKTAARISLKLNKGTDADILRRLDEVPSKQGYIKELIRADITRAQ